LNLYKIRITTAFLFACSKLVHGLRIPGATFRRWLYVGFFIAPTDFQQGDAYRIMFIHVPAAWMGMFFYVLMAFYAAIGWAFNARLASMMASSISITGALFTLISLVTGSFWGKPTWGTWWVWDARMTSTLILLFLYIGFISLQAAIDEPRRADRAGAVLAVVGVVNVPIIYFSCSGGTRCIRARPFEYEQTHDSRANAGCDADSAGGVLVVFRSGGAGARALHYFGEGAECGTRCRGCCLVMDWSKFFYMGGYGFYVWGSYLFTFLIWVQRCWQLRRRRKPLGQQDWR